MKGIGKAGWWCAGTVVLILSLHLWGDQAWAAEKASDWRGTYDLIMRWVNFAIIVFLLNKYAKGPVLNFLRGRGEKVAQEIKTLEGKRDETVAQIKETQKSIDESEVLFDDLKHRIVQQGDKQKQEIIESARQQSRIMLDDAHRRVDSYMLEAKSAIRAEMVDFAIDFAMQRLPREITAEDNQKFIDEFLASTQTK